MIFNRTEEDVKNAKKIRAEKIQNFQGLTESEIETLEKGTITHNTLNRIEEKQKELKNLFEAIGYWNIPITNKSWDEEKIFNIDEFRRIIENADVLRESFFSYKDTPKTPAISYHYKDINDLEKILHDLDNMIYDVKSNYKECGNFECGED